MEESQWLFNLTVLVSSDLKIDLNEIKNREEWNDAKNSFVRKVTSVMFQLENFGFKKSEISSFISGTEITLNYALFFYILKKVSKNATDEKELKTKIIKEWNSRNVLDNLDEMSEVILDDFFEKKGGVVFRDK